MIGKMDTRQKMINMLYLVFIAMLALNISKEVLATLGILNDDLEFSIVELESSSKKNYDQISSNSDNLDYKIAAEMVGDMKNVSNDLYDFIENIKSSEVREITHFNIRIGIHTGPVVAGVVGLKKFAYDIWGDTVNIASRLESNSEPGKINISENTYHLIKDSFDCEYRGEIQAKNTGMMKMYYVHHKKGMSKPFTDSEKSEALSNNNSQERAS